jgi:protein SCO1/2
MSALILLPLLLGACRAKPYEWHGTAYDPPRPAPAIPLQAVGGGDFDVTAMTGKAAILYFGYINCPDICPATLANLAWVRGELGEKADDFVVLFVTVDPAHDTLPALTDYLNGFDPTFVGLRGERPQTEAVLATYGVYADLSTADAAHEIEHSARLFAIDRQGDLVATYTWDVPREDLLADVQHLLSS